MKLSDNNQNKLLLNGVVLGAVFMRSFAPVLYGESDNIISERSNEI
jgi:hypothetical protein